jgi:citrate synthase
MPVISKGLEGIVANSTRLSDVLGEKGQLIYAGYDINELAGKVSYEEIVHLLWHGHLPSRKELTDLENNLRSRRDLPQGVINFIETAPKKSNPMDVIRTAISMLGLYDTELEEDINVDKNRIRALHITAKIGVIAAPSRPPGPRRGSPLSLPAQWRGAEARGDQDAGRRLRPAR